MKNVHLLGAVFLVIVALTTPGQAGDFPGQGDRKAWQKASVQYNQGLVFSDQGRWDESIKCFKAAVAIYPYDGHFYHSLGRAYYKKQDLKTSEIMYKKAIELHPSDTWMSWANLAEVYYGGRRYRDAHEACANALKGAPDTEKPKLQNALRTIDGKLEH